MDLIKTICRLQMGDTFQHDFSDDEFEGEAEEKVATLTMWPGPGSVPFEPRVLASTKAHLLSAGLTHCRQLLTLHTSRSQMCPGVMPH